MSCTYWKEITYKLSALVFYVEGTSNYYITSPLDQCYFCLSIEAYRLAYVMTNVFPGNLYCNNMLIYTHILIEEQILYTMDYNIAEFLFVCVIFPFLIILPLVFLFLLFLYLFSLRLLQRYYKHSYDPISNDRPGAATIFYTFAFTTLF